MKPNEKGCAGAEATAFRNAEAQAREASIGFFPCVAVMRFGSDDALRIVETYEKPPTTHRARVLLSAAVRA
jgi:hypothetical protein